MNRDGFYQQSLITEQVQIHKACLASKERKLSEKSHIYIEYAYALNMQDIKVAMLSEAKLGLILRISLETTAQVRTIHRYTHSELDSHRWPFLEMLPGPYYKV